jgi:hypothetical protein
MTTLPGPLFAFFFVSPLTALLAAAGAVSIPIIIHLLNRRRYRIVTWAAMRFLLAAQKKNTRRMRLEQIILLAMRILIVLLLVLAMAAGSREEWANNLWKSLFPQALGRSLGSSRPTHKILVLDASFSMALKDGDTTCFDRARAQAAKILETSANGDGFSVVLMTGVPASAAAPDGSLNMPIVVELSDDAGETAKVIRDKNLPLPHGNADLPATLNLVHDMLKRSPRDKYVEREVYFLTDLQRSTWIGPRGLDEVLRGIQQEARTIFVDVGRKGEVGNLTVTHLALGVPVVTTEGETPIEATIHNYGNQARKGARVELLIGKARLFEDEQARDKAKDQAFPLQAVREASVDVPGGGRATVNFTVNFRKIFKDARESELPGDYAVQVRVEPDDLEVDDSRTVIVPVKAGLPVLLVNGKPSPTGEHRDNASYYLYAALNPFELHNADRPEEKIPVPAFAPARVAEKSESQFSDAGAGDLKDYDLVFLSDVPRLSSLEVRRLETHLRRGGGLVICLGPQVDLANYNDLLYCNGQGILPARLIKQQVAPKDGSFGFELDADSQKRPPLAAIAASSEGKGSLLRAKVYQYVRAELAPYETRPGATGRADLPHGPAHKILSFVPNVPASAKPAEPAPAAPVTARDPAVIEWDCGRGKVVLVTTPVYKDNDTYLWPGSQSFVILMQELMYFAGANRVRARAATVGDTLEQYLPETGGPNDVPLSAPDPNDVLKAKLQKGKTQRYDEEVRVLRWPHTAISGIYRVTVDQREHLFAVNVPVATGNQASESDLKRTSEQELHDQYRGWDFQYVTDLERVSHSGGPAAVAAPDKPDPGIGPFIARILLFVMLGLVLIEVLLAWLFGHYTTVAGETTKPSPWDGILATGVAAGATLAFALLAFVLIHDAIRHDFMSFLGDGIRGSIEKQLGVPPPPSGENTRWHLEYTPYFGTGAMTLGMAILIALGALGLVVGIYVLEGRTARWPYKLLFGGLRLFLILLTLAVLLPQLQLSFQRQSRPEIVLLIDVSGSMSATDRYRDEDIVEAARQLAQEADRLAQEKERVAAAKTAAAEEKERQLHDHADKNSKAFEALVKEARDLRDQARDLQEEAAALHTIVANQDADKAQQLQRLQLAQALLSRKNADQLDWLETLLSEHKVRVKVYAFAGRAVRVTTLEEPADLAKAREELLGLRAKPENDTSQHGTSLRQVFADARGRPPAAVIVVTDGVTSPDEEDLAAAAHSLAETAKAKKEVPTPLFFVGVGDAHEVRDLRIDGVEVKDAITLHDQLVFTVRVTGQGYTNLEVPLTLREKVRDKDGKETEKVLHTEKVRVDPLGKPVEVKIRYKPTEPGEKVFVLDVPEQDDEVKPADNNRMERVVYVRESKIIKVLYVEGAPRYDYRYIKHLLERESAREVGNKSIDLRVLLLDADENYAKEDKSALNPPEFPNKIELNQYDVVIFGDVDPQSPKLGEQNLKNLADFVRERGGGFLMVAGEQFSPHAYKDTPLADILPIEVTGPAPPEPEDGLEEGYRLEVTKEGAGYPMFQFAAGEAENTRIRNQLAEMYWWSEGYRSKDAAKVLAVHPKRAAAAAGLPGPSGKGRHPLVVHQLVGAGHSMFFGFDESWRWRYREDELRFNQFWIQTVHFLSKSGSDRVKLTLDPDTPPYRRGKPIRVKVQFPLNAPLPSPQTEVKVVKERTSFQGAGPGEFDVETLLLARDESNPAVYKGLLTHTPEGKYRFWLSAPTVSGSKPQAECRVLPPEGEMDHLRMDQPVMKEAADATGGGFYTLADADKLLEALPSGKRIALNAQGEPRLLWNSAALLALALWLVGMEWFLRKRRHLL